MILITLDFMHYLPNDILCKVDRASMSQSLETRAPYLDHELFRLMWRLPFANKIKSKSNKIHTKSILRDIVSDRIPAEIINRPKEGFGIPISDWLRGGLKEWAEDLLSEDMVKKHNILDFSEVSSLWISHQKKEKDNSHKLWSILVLQNWLSCE